MAVVSGPLAEIRVNGVTVGLMKDVRANDNIRRGRVRGIGRANPIEVPVLEWEGELTCSFYLIDLLTSGIPGAEKRQVNSEQEWLRGIIFDEVGVDVVVFKKIAGAVDPETGIPAEVLAPLATIRGCFLERRNFNVAESQLSGTDQSFVFIHPIIFPV